MRKLIFLLLDGHRYLPMPGRQLGAGKQRGEWVRQLTEKALEGHLFRFDGEYIGKTLQQLSRGST